MSRLTFETNSFRCNVRCGRCTFVKPNAERCKNRVCIGTPVCWVHTKRLYGVRCAQSNVAAAGKGLFAVTGFGFDDWICPYGGENINQNCLDMRYEEDETATYATRVSANSIIDGACVRGIGAMANGLFRNDGRPRSENSHNAKIVTRRNRGLWLKATRNIPAGREIFAFYGYEYIIQDEYNHVTRRTTRADNRPC